MFTTFNEIVAYLVRMRQSSDERSLVTYVYTIVGECYNLHMVNRRRIMQELKEEIIMNYPYCVRR